MLRRIIGLHGTEDLIFLEKCDDSAEAKSEASSTAAYLLFSLWITSHDTMAHAYWQLSFPFASVVMASYFSPPSPANCEQSCSERAAPHVSPSVPTLSSSITGARWDASSKHHPVSHVNDCSGTPRPQIHNWIYCSWCMKSWTSKSRKQNNLITLITQVHLSVVVFVEKNQVWLKQQG